MIPVFLFEGDPQTTQALDTQLRKQGIRIHASTHLQDAVNALQTETPRLLIFDLIRPLHEVEALYQWVLQHPTLKAQPRIFLSLPEQQAWTAKMRALGEEHIFERPLRPSRFLQTIHDLLGHSSPKVAKKDALSVLAGRKIGSFILEEEIGRGGMGAVFRANQETLQRKVAVKVMLPSAQQDEMCLRRFQREALAIAQLRSPHIVQIFDAGTTQEGMLYIVMEFLEGENLDQFLCRHTRLPETEALSIVEQTALGLLIAHRAGQIHRDLKPSNLIRNKDGQITLTDFGLVRLQQDTTHTQPGIVVGSPHYLSPEQAEGKDLDHRSDIYALGIVFFELLAGVPPFIGSNISHVMLKHISEPLPDIRRYAPQTSDKTIQIIQKMTQKKPVDRFQDAQEILLAIQNLRQLHGLPSSQPNLFAAHSTSLPFAQPSPAPVSHTLAPAPMPHPVLAPTHMAPSLAPALPPAQASPFLPQSPHAPASLPTPLSPPVSPQPWGSPAPAWDLPSLAPLSSSAWVPQPHAPAPFAPPDLFAAPSHPHQMTPAPAPQSTPYPLQSPPSSTPSSPLLAVHPNEPCLSAEAFDALQEEYTRYVGPIAPIALKQTIKAMGYSKKAFPYKQGEQLILKLAERLDNQKQKSFLNAALPLLAKS